MSRLTRTVRRACSAAVTAVQIASLTHAPAPQPATCECGAQIPEGRALSCWRCRFDNDDHGTDYTDEEAS